MAARTLSPTLFLALALSLSFTLSLYFVLHTLRNFCRAYKNFTVFYAHHKSFITFLLQLLLPQQQQLQDLQVENRQLDILEPNVLSFSSAFSLSPRRRFCSSATSTTASAAAAFCRDGIDFSLEHCPIRFWALLAHIHLLTPRRRHLHHKNSFSAEVVARKRTPGPGSGRKPIYNSNPVHRKMTMTPLSPPLRARLSYYYSSRSI